MAGMKDPALLNTPVTALPSSRNLDAQATVTNMPSLCKRQRHVCHLIFGSCLAEEQLPGSGNREQERLELCNLFLTAPFHVRVFLKDLSLISFFCGCKHFDPKECNQLSFIQKNLLFII